MDSSVKLDMGADTVSIPLNVNSNISKASIGDGNKQPSIASAADIPGLQSILLRKKAIPKSSDVNNENIELNASIGSLNSSDRNNSADFIRCDIEILNIDDIIFEIPVRKILLKDDLVRFQESSYHNEIIEFLLRLQDSIVDVRITDVLHKFNTLPNEISPIVQSIRHMLDTIENWVDEYPPLDIKSRFGNPAFKTWYKRLDEEIDASINYSETDSEDISLLSFLPLKTRKELGGYLKASFGSAKRVDYGTGHELSFLVFILSLYKLQLLKPEDHKDITILLIWRYIGTMRKLQFTYLLEPAGSQGVWGLDDYHFLPFLLGAAQLRNHKFLRPKSIHSNDIIAEYSKDFMYLSCIEFVNSVKTASLRWHSPMLDDVSGVKTWSKVASGMVKMYKAEVLGKLPIMQHFLFGSLIPFEASVSLTEIEGVECDDGHIHANGEHHIPSTGMPQEGAEVLPGVEHEFPGCCGIRVPSAIGAFKANSSARSNVPRAIPFD